MCLMTPLLLPMALTALTLEHRPVAQSLSGELCQECLLLLVWVALTTAVVTRIVRRMLLVSPVYNCTVMTDQLTPQYHGQGNAMIVAWLIVTNWSFLPPSMNMSKACKVVCVLVCPTVLMMLTLGM